jgi:hypothetical protein
MESWLTGCVSLCRGKDSQKFTIQTPFSILPQLLGPYAFSPTNRSTLNDRMDLYYQDFSFVPLFMQVRLGVSQSICSHYFLHGSPCFSG